MEENKNTQEKEKEESDINNDKVILETSKDNSENNIFTIDQCAQYLENTSNISNKFLNQYQNEELNKFKDEILSFFKDRDKYFSNLINTYKNQIQVAEKKYENLAKLIKLNYEEILSSQASLNNRLDKFNSYDAFVAKTNDNITSHEIRINHLREDYNKTVHKYDKIYLDNLELPGYIGRCAKYKNCQLFFEDVIKEINKFNNYKEKNNIDLKSYKEKLEYTIKTFSNLLKNNNDTQIKYINQLNEKNIKESKNMVDNLSERVMELRLENSKHSLELINKSDELKEQMNKIKEMKGELLNEFYNKIDDYKIETNKAINSFNEFKNEYAVIRKKFLELAEFIKDIRFKKNLGGDISKKEISDLYKNLIKKNKKSNKDKNVELLTDIAKIEKMEFNTNKTNSNNNTSNSNQINKEQNLRGKKKHETYNCTKDLIKGNIFDLNLNNKNENMKNETEISNANNNINIIDNDNEENKTDINNEEGINTAMRERKIFILKENNNSRSTKNIFNNKINKETEKEKEMKNTYDNTNNININNINNQIIDKNLTIEPKHQKEEENTIKINKIEISTAFKSSNKKNLKEKDKEKKCTTEADTLSITDSCCSININNTIGVTGTLSDKNISNISVPNAYNPNMNNFKCSKFVFNDMCQDDNDNKIIKELAAELEQSTAKKNKKNGNKNSKNTIQKIEPINLVKNINIKDVKKESNKNNEIQNSLSFKIENKNKEKIGNKLSKGEQTQPIIINDKVKSLINQDIDSEYLDNNIQSKKNSNIKDITDINSPTSINTNFDKFCNLNSDLETNTESKNSKLGIFGQKLTDIETYMKNKFIELSKQINDLKQQNIPKKQNLNRTVGYKSDKNIFNFLNNDNFSNNYSLSIRDERPDINNYRVIKLQKPELYSHFFPSDIDTFKRSDFYKDNYLLDNWNINRDSRNDDISVVKQFIERKINIKNNNLNKELYKKNFKGIFRDKKQNLVNSANGCIDPYDNGHNKIRNNSSNLKNDMKYVDLKVLINRKIPKNSNSQKINILLSGENK